MIFESILIVILMYVFIIIAIHIPSPKFKVIATIIGSLILIILIFKLSLIMHSQFYIIISIINFVILIITFAKANWKFKATSIKILVLLIIGNIIYDIVVDPQLIYNMFKLILIVFTIYMIYDFLTSGFPYEKLIIIIYLVTSLISSFYIVDFKSLIYPLPILSFAFVNNKNNNKNHQFINGNKIEKNEEKNNKKICELEF